MPRRQKMEVGGLNVRVHPHEEGTYRDLMESLYRLKSIEKIRGDRHGLITMLNRADEDERYIFGVLSTFLEIEMEGDWFNTDTMEEATQNDISRIQIPDYLHPNLKTFRFMFDTERHELVFEHYSEGDRLTHQSALAFFRNLAAADEIKERFGEVKISVIHERGSIEKIFSIPRITDLEVYIEKPNSDLWGADFEEQAEEHLEDKNARSMNVKYRAEQGAGIKRDEDLDALIRASINNGRSVAKGYGPEGHQTVSTDSYPKVDQEMFEQDVEPGVIFRKLARAFRR
ncbi:MAG: DUF4747 family protein [Erythrobacter sp.]|uniref:DUF4747 family protein n=1 Tax=Erythrobacter sp. TaxID=1042 RepID=UPI001B1FCA0C|nr:DUF4747 family protein [Erythrobacter sp.]MBO6769239.1 DUF4747 family protein [Erythrobacter sp.]